jgi:hypothetical protein
MNKKKQWVAMNKKTILFTAILFLLPLTVQAATISCNTQANCNSANGETEVLQLHDTNNSHGAEPNWNDADNGYPTGYANKVCCTNIENVTPVSNQNCTDGTVNVLNLYQTTNSHAESPFLNNYTTHICIAGIQENVSIKPACGETETCLVLLSNVTNAHLASCGSPAPGYQAVCIPSESTNGGPENQGILMIQDVSVTNPAYNNNSLDVIVTIAKNASALNLEVTGSVRVQFKEASPLKVLDSMPKTDGISIPAGESKTVATLR